MTSACILLVDDDENDVLLMQRAFKNAQVDNPLKVAVDGQGAMDYLAGVGRFSKREEHPLPRLIITDLKLSDKTGLDLLRWVRTQAGLRKTPVLVLSASANPEEVEAAYESGANSFLVKPSSFQELVEMLKAIKGFWLTYDRHLRIMGHSGV